MSWAFTRSEALTTSVLASAWLRWARPAMRLVPMAPTSPAIHRPSKATAISTSMSVNPCSLPSAASMSDLDLVEDAVHRRHECDGHEAHDETHSKDYRRLEQVGELL